MTKKLIAGFGEIMLRLSPDGKKRFAQVLPGELEATFGGGESNFCASIALLGMPSRYLTALPDNAIAHCFGGFLASIGVDNSKICYSKKGRMGIYYAEHGSNMRGSNVIYDRDYSTISLFAPEDYDFDSMLDGVTHLHLTGITPSLTENAFKSTLALAKSADAKGITISLDLNYRKKLWNWDPALTKNQLAEKCMRQIAAFADIIIGNEEDAQDVFGISADNTSIDEGKLNIAGYKEVASKLSAAFPKAKFVAITLRESISADHNNWGGMLYDCKAKQAHFAPLDANGDYKPYEIHHIIDRFGGGDSFGAGLVFALNDDELCEPATAIKFAVASSAWKHTIRGDVNYASKAEIMGLMKGNTSGRVKR